MRSSGWIALVGIGAALTMVAGVGAAALVGPAATPSTATTETVTFTEKGLPSGTEWWLNVTGGASTSSTTTTLSFSEPAGKYTYTVATANKDYLAKGGSFKVGTKAVSKKVKFKLETFKVTVTETGLPVKTKWCFDLTGVKDYCTKSGGSVHFTDSNGTYAYTLTTTASGYTGPAGSVVVQGTTSWPVTFST